MTNLKAVDAPSYVGQFGWEKISEDEAIPVIVRSNNVRYSPVRIVEQEIIKKYDVLPQSVFQCITLKSYYLTLIEAKLLNTINFNHCNNRYGEDFFNQKDVIISARDAKELDRYLTVAKDIFSHDLSKNSQSFGIIRVTLDPHNPTSTMLIPYITKHTQTNPLNQAMSFISMKMISGTDMYSASAVRTLPTDWDVMYLKMMAIYCDNNSRQLITREDELISVEGLIYSKTGAPIVYETYVNPSWSTG